MFRVFVKHFYIKKEVKRFRFGEHVRSSKHEPKNIGICSGVKICYLGIIKTPKNLRKYIRIPRKTHKKKPKMFAVFWALLDL